MTNSLFAVMTGDLVGSTAQPTAVVDGAMQAIRNLGTATDAWAPGPAGHRFTRFRGDGWQMLVHPSLALRAAVVIQGRLMALGLETRIAIGIGRVDSLGTVDLADASGPAFALSGRALDRIDDHARLSIEGAGIIPQDAMIADLLGDRMGRWTAAQAEAAALQLGSPDRVVTLQEIGTQLGISPQAVNDRVRGAGCHAIGSVLRRWEAEKRKSSGDMHD